MRATPVFRPHAVRRAGRALAYGLPMASVRVPGHARPLIFVTNLVVGAIRPWPAYLR